jgi:hypothetical protein
MRRPWTPADDDALDAANRSNLADIERQIRWHRFRLAIGWWLTLALALALAVGLLWWAVTL